MWNYSNPVDIVFGAGKLSHIAELIEGRSYALVTYGEGPFSHFTTRLQAVAGIPKLTFDQVKPNPSFGDQKPQKMDDNI